MNVQRFLIESDHLIVLETRNITWYLHSPSISHISCDIRWSFVNDIVLNIGASTMGFQRLF